MAKNQANAHQYQQPEAEILTFANYSHSSSTLSTKINRTYFKKISKKQVCLFSREYMINHSENEDENEIIDHIDTALINLGLDMNKNRINIKVSQYDDAYT